MNETETIGEYIRRRRLELGIRSQRQLAYMSGVSNTEIKRIEEGERIQPTQKTLDKFADPLRTPSETLYRLAGYKTGNESELPAYARPFKESGADIYVGGPEIKIPVYEEAAAGSPCIVDERPIGLEQVTAEAVAGDVMNYVLVKVRGDSMRDAGIMPDTTHLQPPALRIQSRVLVHLQPVVEDNQIALVRYTETGDVTIKLVHFVNGDQVQLIPANPAYRIEERKRSEIVIIGQVTEIYTRFV